ncbi:hypothetical protein LPJ73_000578 [Coemansia sp. RSA 2703]|nr:hypothetical protein LPJ73_000578 [Coemansia sp. RSA 2703]
MTSNNTTSTPVQMQAKGNRAFYQALQASRSAPGNDFIEVDRSIRVKYPKLYHALARQLKDPELADKAFRKGLINLVIDYSSEDESDEDSDMNVSNHEDNAIFYDSLDMEVDEADVSVAISEDADDIAAGAMATRDIATHGHAADEEDNDDDDDSANDDSTDGNVSDNDAPSAMAADDSAASASAASASAASASAASASAASASAASASAASASAASASAASASAASASAPITSAPITSVPITSAPITSAPITTASDDSAPITMAADDSAADDDSVGINVVRNPMSSDNDSDNDSTDDSATSRRIVVHRSSRSRSPYSARTPLRRSSRSPIHRTLFSTTTIAQPARVESNDSGGNNLPDERQRTVGYFALTEQQAKVIRTNKLTQSRLSSICQKFEAFAHKDSNRDLSLNGTTDEEDEHSELYRLIEMSRQSQQQQQQQPLLIRRANGHTVVSLEGLINRNSRRTKENTFTTNFLYLVVCGMYYAGAKAILTNIDPDKDILPLQLDIPDNNRVPKRKANTFHVALTATHYQTVTQDNHRKILKWMYERMRSTPPSEDAINEEACKKKFNKMARAIYRRGRQYVQLCMIAGFHSLDFLLVKLAPTNLDQTTENLVAFESCLIAMGEKFNNQVQTGIDDNFDVLEMARYADYVDGMQEYTRLLHEYSDVAAFIEAFCTYLYT